MMIYKGSHADPNCEVTHATSHPTHPPMQSSKQRSPFTLIFPIETPQPKHRSLHPSSTSFHHLPSEHTTRYQSEPPPLRLKPRPSTSANRPPDPRSGPFRRSPGISSPRRGARSSWRSGWSPGSASGAAWGRCRAAACDYRYCRSMLYRSRIRTDR